VAPGPSSVGVVALHRTHEDSYGNSQIEGLVAARFTRHSLQGVKWQQASAFQVVRDATDQLKIRLTGPSKNLAPLDLSAEPESAKAIEAFDKDALTDDDSAG
jgi:hypothetical protein